MTNSQGTYIIKSTPETVVINKAYSDLTVVCEKDGKSSTSVHQSAANGATFGNILLGGTPGALVDGGSGAGYDYQSYLVNGLRCTSTTAATAPPVAAISSPSTKTVEERLKELKDLQTKGLISDEDAKIKRQQILSSM